MKEGIPKQPEKFAEHEKAKHLAWDIVNSRLKKILTLSSGPLQGEQIVNKLTSEEKLLFEQLGKIISQWRTQILEYQNEGQTT
jgi:DNA replication initiation complex subunit (GINS family)